VFKNPLSNLFKHGMIIWDMAIKSKRGVSHIEFIFSLLIFLGFMGTALFFFSPTGDTNVVGETLDYSFDRVLKEVETDVHTYGVKLDLDVLNGQGQNVVPIQIDNFLGNVRVEDVNGNVLESGRKGYLVYFKHDNKAFVYVKISEDFENRGLSSMEIPNTNGYEISSSISEKVISVKRVKTLKERYNSNYDSLKEEFRLPGIINFGFSLDSDSEQIEADREGAKEEVFSKMERLETLKEDGSREFGSLLVKVW
jgi:hypothetical protein